MPHSEASELIRRFPRTRYEFPVVDSEAKIIEHRQDFGETITGTARCMILIDMLYVAILALIWRTTVR